MYNIFTVPASWCRYLHSPALRVSPLHPFLQWIIQTFAANRPPGGPGGAPKAPPIWTPNGPPGARWKFTLFKCIKFTSVFAPLYFERFRPGLQRHHFGTLWRTKCIKFPNDYSTFVFWRTNNEFCKLLRPSGPPADQEPSRAEPSRAGRSTGREGVQI